MNAVIVARAVMGVGAALVTPLALSVLPTLFGPEERTKAVGITSAASAIGIAFLRLPAPRDEGPRLPRGRHRLDGTRRDRARRPRLGIIEAPTRGWGDPLVLGTLGASVVLIAALVLRERRVERPMLDLTLLAHRGFLFNTVAATLVPFVLTGLLFVLPPYLQAVLGHDALGTGVRLLPMMGGLLVASRLAPQVVARFGARAAVSAGLVVLAFAGLLGSRTTADSGYGFVALWLTITGLGFGLSLIPAMNGGLSALPRDRAGWGSPHAFKAVGEDPGC